MLTKLKVFGPTGLIQEFFFGTSLEEGLGLVAPEQLPIRNIDGLGPVTTPVNTAALGSLDSEFYVGGQMGKRNIVLTFGANPDWVDQSVTSLRAALYKIFMPKSLVRLQFFSDYLPTVQIDGYVESLEPNMFSKDPEIQISVVCPSPDFVASTFTFINGTVDDNPDFFTAVDIDYIGTRPTGIQVLVSTSETTPTYVGPITIGVESVENLETVTEQITFNASVDADDFVILTTTPGNKTIIQYAEVGSGVSLLSTVSGTYKWPQLRPGLNKFDVSADTAGQNWGLAYYARFGGL